VVFGTWVLTFTAHNDKFRVELHRPQDAKPNLKARPQLAINEALFFADDIELFANWATIAGLPCFPLFVFLLHRKGLRFSVVLGALCCAVGTALRCLPVNTDVLK